VGGAGWNLVRFRGTGGLLMKLHINRARWLVMLGAVVVLAGLWLVSPALGWDGPIYAPNQYFVQVQPGTSLSTVQQLVSSMGGTIIKEMPLPDTYLVEMTGAKSNTTKRTLSASPMGAQTKWVITGFYPNTMHHLDAIPNDPNWDKQWNMTLINMPQAWDRYKGNSAVGVAVIDSGVWGDHEDLKGRVVGGYDYVDNDSDPTNDLVGHGTHCAGIIGAIGDNGIGICGINWGGVSIIPVRIFGAPGTGATTDVIVQALNYVHQYKDTYNIQVVNMSFGGAPGVEDPVEHAAITQLANDQIVLCAAAGNDGTNSDHGVSAPALYPECIAVSAVGPTDQLAYYSSWGPSNEVDIAAPGGDDTYGLDMMVLSTVPQYSGSTWTSGYEYMQGTSMACPHVAGAAALLLSSGVARTDVRNRLLDTARIPKPPVVFDKRKFGAGILDMASALSSGSIRIVKPSKGAYVTNKPDFKFSVRGIDPTSIAVYVDYTDLNDDGTPDNLANEIPVISGVPASQYLDQTQTTMQFNWAEVSQVPLSVGLHFIYVTAKTTNGDVLSDWGVFNVVSQVIPAGVHLFSFPISLAATNPFDGTVTMTANPSEVLLDNATGAPLDFRVSNPGRAQLVRWLAPMNTYYSYITGTSDPNDNSPRFDDRAWMNPLARMTLPSGVSQIIPTGGGYRPDVANHYLQFPAGAGFWLILKSDAIINDIYPAISAPGGFNIYLYKGWNLIGNPYTTAVPRKSILLTYRGETKTLDEAGTGANAWVQPQIYGYSTVGTPGYQIIPDRGMLNPYEGYWIRTLVGGIDPHDSLVMTVQP